MTLNALRGPTVKPAAQNIREATPQAPLPPIRAVRNVPVSEGVIGAERRRSQRVLLRVRADIHVAVLGVPKSFEVLTLSVSPHGAMVIMKEGLPPETRLVLEHRGTRQKVACKVVRASREMPEGFHIPLEFDSPAPDFWRIAFPPVDWRPEDM